MTLPSKPFAFVVGWTAILGSYAAFGAAAMHTIAKNSSETVSLGLWVSLFIGAPICLGYSVWWWLNRPQEKAHKIGAMLGFLCPALAMVGLETGYLVLAK
jgi:hypothetical protein